MSKYLVPNKYNGDTEFVFGRSRYNWGGSDDEAPASGVGEAENPMLAELRRQQASGAANLNKIAFGENGSNGVVHTGMNNLLTMANESINGTLTNRLRDQALSDVNTSLGTSANDALRVMSSRGAAFDPTSASGADVMSQWGLGAAKQRAGAANLANANGDAMRWQMNSGLTGLATNQGAQAMQSVGQLSNQISQ